MGLKSNLLGQSRESLPTGLYGVSKVNLCLPLRQGPNYLIEAENAGRIAPPRNLASWFQRNAERGIGG